MGDDPERMDAGAIVAARGLAPTGGGAAAPPGWLYLVSHRAGLPGLIPQRSGPRQAHKLSDFVVDFLLQHRLRDPLLRAPALSELVREHFGLVVHPRSIERALERRRKKVPR